MMVSVVIPVYNCENKIERCINSLLSQSYKSIEILLIDDKSQDSCGEICDKYSSIYDRVKVIHNKENSGASFSRNVGIQNATGDYICFVDSDDYVEQDYIQNFIDGLKIGDELVFQGICIVRNGIREKRRPIAGRYENDNVLEGISDINRYSMFGYVCNKLYKTSIIRSNGLCFDTSINISEDRIFALHYIRYVNCLVTIPKCSYVYEIQASGLTNKYRTYNEIKAAADSNLQAAMLLLEKWKSARFLNDTKRMYIMTSFGYIRALFQQKGYAMRYRSYVSYYKKYRSWLRFYTPQDRSHKIIKGIISIPPSCASFILMNLYCAFKNR